MRNTILFMLMVLLVAGAGYAASPVTNGLVKHVDASAITGLNDGDPVTTWTDLSAVANDFLAPEGREPNYLSAGLNGQPAIQFNGYDDYLLAQDSSTDLFNGDQPFTTFLVTSLGAFGAGHSNGAIGLGVGTGTRVVSMLTFESYEVTGNRLYGGFPNCNNSFLTLGTPVLVENSYAGGGLVNYGLRYDGVSKTVINTNTTTHAFNGSSIVLGNAPEGYIGDVGSPYHYNGDIAEVLVFNRIPSNNERNHVGSYLADKYGLTTSYVDPGPYAVAVSPLDGASDLNPATTSLEWVGMNGTGLTYEVRIDTDSDLSDAPVHTTTAASYSPALLLDTEYFWRVDIQGGNQGTLQSFTTAGAISNPDPSADEIRIEMNLAALTWDEANLDGESYDVYFAADGDALVKVDTVSEGSYPLTAVLDPNAIYNWRIDTVLGAETVTGDEYSFHTGGMAVNPNPTDGAKGASSQPVLSWDGDRDGATYIDEYDVYVDFGSGLVLQDTVTDTSYEITTELAEGATYDWKVVAKHDGSEIVSYQPTWNFTTGQLLYYNPLGNIIDSNDLVAYPNGVPTVVISRPGTTDGDPNIVPGIVGDAMYFRSDDTALKIDHTANPNYWKGTGNGLTVAVWAKWKVGDAYQTMNSSGTFVGMYESDPDWILRLDSYYNRTHLRWSGSTMTATVSEFNQSETWHHHIVTAGPSGRRYFVDGILRRDYDPLPSYTASDNPVFIGARLGNGDAWRGDGIFKGSLDELYIYDRPLTEAQAIALYESQGAMAKRPDPATASIDAPYDGVLSWTPGVGIANQKLYFGETKDFSGVTPIDLGPGVDTYDIGCLELETTYFWRIDSLDSGDSVVWEGDVWNFTTMPLVGDVVVNKIVGMPDLQAVAADWLTDTRSIPTEDVVIPWTEYSDLADYFTPRLTVYNNSWAELNLSPESDPNHTCQVSRTVRWWLDTDSSDYAGGQQYEANFRFMEPMDLTQYETVTLWVRPNNVLSNGYHKSPSWLYSWVQDGTIPQTPEGVPIGWTEASAANDGAGKWVKLVYPVSGITSGYGTPWGDIEFWFNQGTTQKVAQAAAGDCYFEFGEMVLTPKAGLTEPVCHLGVAFKSADFNQDCDVDLYDFAAFASNWLEDANCPM